MNRDTYKIEQRNKAICEMYYGLIWHHAHYGTLCLNRTGFRAIGRKREEDSEDKAETGIISRMGLIGRIGRYW